MGKADIEKEKAAAAGTEAAKQNRQGNYHPNSAIAQRQRIAEWFKFHISLTTQQARHELDIMHPAGRIKEMRARGYDILTVWDDCPTTNGRLHRMARYVLIGRNGGSHE